jgi:hypothetical protein
MDGPRYWDVARKVLAVIAQAAIAAADVANAVKDLVRLPW